METGTVPAGLPDIVRMERQVEELGTALVLNAEGVVQPEESGTPDTASEECSGTAVQDSMVGYSVDTWFTIQKNKRSRTVTVSRSIGRRTRGRRNEVESSGNDVPLGPRWKRKAKMS